MELEGKVISVLPVESGEGRNGPWKKQNVIIETQEQYPKKVCLTLWGDRTENPGVEEGEIVNAKIDIESREYNGRWYTDIKAWQINPATTTSSAPGSNIPDPGEEDIPPFEPDGDIGDDPF